MIMEYYRIEATDTDVLAAPSRLSAIPYNGTLIIECQSQHNDATNFYEITVQLPDGSTPVDGQRIPTGATDTAINLDDKYTMAFPVTLGGHVLLQCTENGTAVMDMRITLSP